MRSSRQSRKRSTSSGKPNASSSARSRRFDICWIEDIDFLKSQRTEIAGIIPNQIIFSLRSEKAWWKSKIHAEFAKPRVRFPAGLRCVFSSDPAASSSIFVGAKREENLIRNDPDKSEFTIEWI